MTRVASRAAARMAIALTVKVAGLPGPESYAAPLPDPAEVRDTKFGNGLEVILDGLALRLKG